MNKTVLVAGSIFLLVSLFFFSPLAISDAGVATSLSSERAAPFLQLAQSGNGAPGPPAPPPGITPGRSAGGAPVPPQAVPTEPLSREATPQVQPQPEAPQPPSPVPAPRPQTPAIVPAQAPPGAPQLLRRASQQAEGAVSFFFDDADIFEVVQTIFGEVLKVNYLIDQRVKGKVNFRTVTPIPKSEILSVMETILRINGIGFVEEKGLYRIVPLTEVPKELVYSQVGKDPENVAIEMFTFKNVNIRETMSDIENAVGLTVSEGKVRVLPIYRLNALLVVASTKEQMNYVRKWVEAFDTLFAEARPKVTVYPLQNSKASHIASMLQSILSGGGGGTSAPAPAPPAPAPKTPTPGAAPTAPAAPAVQPPRAGAGTTVAGSGFLVSPETRVFADEINNNLVILSTPADYAFLEEMIKKIDVAPRQVMLEAYLVAVDLTDNVNFGFSWSATTDINISGLKPFTRPINLTGDMSSVPQGTDLKAAQGDGFTFIGTDPTGTVRVKLVAALKDGTSKVLAAPHVLVSDNREARIQVGSQVPLATSQTSSPIGTGTTVTNTTTSTIQYKDIGIILKVKPQINDSGLISLEIAQEVSKLGDPVIVGGVINPTIDKTEATTTLVAQNGESIIIGGLIREDDLKSVTGIPILSKIPLIGPLFSSTVKNFKRTELIMLLIPHVTRNQEEAKKLTLDYIRKFNKTAQEERIEQFIQERSGDGKSGGNAGAKDAP